MEIVLHAPGYDEFESDGCSDTEGGGSIGGRGERGKGKRGRGKRRPNKRLQCPLCPERQNRLLIHVVTKHLPWFLAAKTACWSCRCQFGKDSSLRLHFRRSETCDEEGSWFTPAHHQTWAVLCMEFLQKIANTMGLLSPGTLLDFALHAQLHPKPDHDVGMVEADLMKMFRQSCQLAGDDPVIVRPPNQVAALLHWRTLTRILEHLPEDQRGKLMHSGWKCALPGFLPVDGHLADPGGYTVDSHFHLDKLLERTGAASLLEVESREVEDGRLDCLIANFVYPEKWESQEWGEHFGDYRIRATFGVHPSRARTCPPDFVERVERLLRCHPKAVGVGEIGLDFHRDTSAGERGTQLKVFRGLLELAVRVKKTIVIHSRGPGATSLCLETMEEVGVPKYHPIHRHCFNGQVEEASEWLRRFPNTAFGFAGALLRPDSPARDTVRHLPLEHVLLETDAPYLLPPGRREKHSSPWMVKLVARYIAKVRGVATREVCAATGRTASRLYGLQLE